MICTIPLKYTKKFYVSLSLFLSKNVSLNYAYANKQLTLER